MADVRLEGRVAHCSGAWTLPWLHELEPMLAQLAWPADSVRFEMSAVSALDTAGAWLLHRTAQALQAQGRRVEIDGLSGMGQALLDLVRSKAVPAGPAGPPAPPPLEALGRASIARLGQNVGFVAFIGEMALALLPVLRHPARFRTQAVLQNLAAAGYRALPIVGLLSFLVGVVIAYQGGVQLRLYGASLYVADLVGLSMLRELSPLITAIIVAGRTGSAFTAEIGTMKVTEEVDALRTIGIAPMELLVLPKLIALLVALPLLTVFADILGIFGGMVMASTMLGVSFVTFLERLAYAVTLESYLIGVGKAPVFAAIIAAVGCYQGFQASGGAESVGRRTTTSVVQSIFLIIVVDAVFSVVFSRLGI